MNTHGVSHQRGAEQGDPEASDGLQRTAHEHDPSRNEDRARADGPGLDDGAEAPGDGPYAIESESDYILKSARGRRWSSKTRTGRAILRRFRIADLFRRQDSHLGCTRASTSSAGRSSA
jgi:hypothetical protein